MSKTREGNFFPLLYILYNSLIKAIVKGHSQPKHFLDSHFI